MKSAPVPLWTLYEWQTLQAQSEGLMRHARGFAQSVNAGAAICTPERVAQLVEDLRAAANVLDYVSMAATLCAAPAVGGEE